ncbi:MAG: diguanylate cyclase [Azoarcus sp.]|jgi:diguanylate cyclase (GGDEF)-like protein/PAS domain S-box-containing protein|nr:diguanylate cyclase [Azoarcus sp.]
MHLPTRASKRLTIVLHFLPMLCIAACIVAIVALWTALFDIEQRGESDEFRHLRALAEERSQAAANLVQEAVERYDLALRAVRETDARSRAVADALTAQQVRIIHVNADGYAGYAGRDNLSYFGDLGFFQELKRRDDDILAIGMPMPSRALPGLLGTSPWFVPFARRKQNGGRFDGLIVLYIPVTAWQAQLRRYLKTDQDFMALLSANGQFILHEPLANGAYGVRAPPDWALLYQFSSSQGTFTSDSAGFQHMIAWNRLELPTTPRLIVAAGFASGEVMAPVRARIHRLKIGAGALSALIALLIGGLIVLLADSWRFLLLRGEHLTLLRGLIDSMSEGIMELDGDRRIVRVNHMFTVITGYPPSIVLGQKPVMLSPDHDTARNLGKMIGQWIEEGGDSPGEGDFDGLRASGETRSFIGHAILAAGKSAATRHRVVLITDVSAARRKAEEVWHETNFDTLTELANDKLMRDHLDLMIHHSATHSCGVAVLFIDLDDFMAIIVRNGREIGERLLYELARRLRDQFHEENTVARLRADQFVVLLFDHGSRSVAERAAAKVVANLSDPFVVDEDGRQVEITCSVGLASLPDNGRTSEELLEHAKQAMLRVKEKGRAGWSS